MTSHPGDAAAHDRFMALFLHHQHDLRAFIRSVVHDWTAVDDIMQETAGVLWRKFADFDGTRSFGAWARGIAGYEILKHRERLGRVPALLSPDAIAALDAAWDDEAAPPGSRLAALQRCLERIDAPSRQVLTLRYRDGLEIAAVGERTGRGAEAVGKLMQRLRTALGDCVRRQLATEGR